MSDTDNADIKKLTFERAIEELETIVKRLEEGKVPLEESVAIYERGDHDNIVNAPLRAGDGGEQFRAAMETRILPRLAAFGPELIIISAGFDAHKRDPLANLQLVEEDFSWATRKIMDVADKAAAGRVVSVLEGGYDLEGLSKSAAAHVIALMRG